MGVKARLNDVPKTGPGRLPRGLGGAQTEVNRIMGGTAGNAGAIFRGV